jgi:hypothetical protein
VGYYIPTPYSQCSPVDAGLVFRAEDYIYSSVVDYACEKFLLDDVMVVW